MKKILFVPMVIAITIPSVFAFSDIKNSDFENYINNMSTEKLISGYDDGTFRPNNNVSFIESLKIAINASDNFSKIIQNSENWWTPYIDFYRNNFLQNTKSFANNDKISRDFAIYLTLRNLDIILTPENTKDLPTFPDVNTNNFFAPYITFAKYAGITSGYANGNFWPNNMVSRGEFTKMIWKTLREDRAAILAKYQELKTSQSTITPTINTNTTPTINTNTTPTINAPIPEKQTTQRKDSWSEFINGNHYFDKNTTAADIQKEVKARSWTNDNDASSIEKAIWVTNQVIWINNALNWFMKYWHSREKILEYMKKNRSTYYNYAITYLNNSGYQQ